MLNSLALAAAMIGATLLAPAATAIPWRMLFERLRIDRDGPLDAREQDLLAGAVEEAEQTYRPPRSTQTTYVDELQRFRTEQGRRTTPVKTHRAWRESCDTGGYLGRSAASRTDRGREARGE